MKSGVDDIEKNLIALALELYYDKFGADEYQKLLDMQREKPASAADVLNNFILENESYLTKEAQVQLLKQAQ